jgi:adenylyltransferase/sulfurtransferase
MNGAGEPGPDRYRRQATFRGLGSNGQDRIRAASVAILGCGALGCTSADLLVRAGVGRVLLIDRDVVELGNLHRQSLYDEQQAREGLPKAVAAHQRLSTVNSEVAIEPLVADLHAGNIEELLGSVHRLDLLVDGTDNAPTRYLLNDWCVKHGVNWIYGACVGAEGRVMPVFPGTSACLRCVFPEMPAPGELETCDAAGVIGPAATIVGALQAASALRMLSGGFDPSEACLFAMDTWTGSSQSVPVGLARRTDCPCCVLRQFDHLGAAPTSSTTLCGRNSVQFLADRSTRLDLPALANALHPAWHAKLGPFFLRLTDTEHPDLTLTLFPDGRAIVGGTTDVTRARSIVARALGR